MTQLIHLENARWQVGILPETGGSVAYGRVFQDGGWMDIMRPTQSKDYERAGACSSFLMMPWANRMKDGLYHADGRVFSLKTVADDGTARHGDVRQRPWTVVSRDEVSCSLHFSSRQFPELNFPFAFEAELSFSLDGASFRSTASLKNVDDVAYPAGFGFHPYFVRDPQTPPRVEIPCVARFPLERGLPLGPPSDIPHPSDFRELRPLDETALDDLFTQRDLQKPALMVFGDHGPTIEMFADPIFAHLLLYAPVGEPFFALEPQSNANDGFRLFAEGMEGTGVFVLPPQTSKNGSFSLVVREKGK